MPGSQLNSPIFFKALWLSKKLWGGSQQNDEMSSESLLMKHSRSSSAGKRYINHKEKASQLIIH